MEMTPIAGGGESPIRTAASRTQPYGPAGRPTWNDRINRLHNILARLKTDLYYRRIFGAIGPHSRIHKPLLLSNPQFVFIGSGTLIRAGARIETLVIDPASPPALRIGSHVNIEQNAHIVCSSAITIGDNVSVGPNCGILDTSHPFVDVDDACKIGDRINSTPSPVEIGPNTLIGFGVAVLPDVRIGRNCVIGANSTVTRSIPDNCVAAGSPARILFSYDAERREWVRPPDPEF
jgi:acetyltransferase-like isoleucine patch superfamily enzyme